ncbi:MAG: hypothetical protein IPK83_05075 [Planctomycetes bacterium]|nr:hypothetical protein [Planctomycetota bacterium]
MLRVLQLELNERTRQLNESLPRELQRSEDQLQNIAKLGEDQREIHEMSVKLIEGQTGE